MRLLRLAVLVAGALVSCTLPHNKVPEPPRGSVTLLLTSPSRTVGVDWADQVKTYEVSLTKVGDGTSVSGTTSVGQSTLTLHGISVGLWDIVVWGRDAAETPIARGSLAAQSLPSASAIAIQVQPLTTGSGGFSFQLRFPQTVDEADRITSVTGQLYTLAGMPFGDAFAFAEAEFASEGAYQAVTFGRASLTPDKYRLSIVLLRAGGVPARYLSEALNIDGGVTADRWIAPDGSLHASRDLTLADFASTNASLGNLALTTTNLKVSSDSSAFAFDDATGHYELDSSSTGATQVLSFTPTEAMPGQALDYSFTNSSYTGDLPGSWTRITSGFSQDALVTAGENQLWIRVTAPDGLTKGYYTVSLNKRILASSVSLAVEMGGPTLASNEARSVRVDFGNAPTDTSVTFTSSDPTVAEVVWDAGTGKYWLWGLKVGTATISVHHLDGVSDSVLVEVVPAFAEVQLFSRNRWSAETQVSQAAKAIVATPTRRLALLESGEVLAFQDGKWMPYLSAPLDLGFLAAAPDGSIYGGSPSEDRVYRFDGVWEPLPGTLSSLEGVAVDRHGQLFVADAGHLKVRSQGLWLTLAALPPQFTALGGGDGIVAVDSDLRASGTLWSWDSGRWLASGSVPVGTVSVAASPALRILRKY